MSLQTLPPELVALIWTFVVPSDAVPFSLTCHHIHDFAGPCLAQHKKMQRRYSTLVIHPHRNPQELFSFFIDSWRFLYPREIFFENALPSTFASAATLNSWTWTHTKTQMMFLIRKGFVKLGKSLNEYTQHDFVMALSFWLLPKLESIRVEANPNDIPFLEVGSLSNQIMCGEDRTRKAALKNVSKLTISGMNDGRCASLSVLKPLITLPALKIFEASGLTMTSKGAPLNCNRQWGIKDLLLQDCVIDAMNLEDMLRWVMNLTHFSYSHCCSASDSYWISHPPSSPWDSPQLRSQCGPKEICEIFIRQVGETLQTLTLDLPCFSDIASGVGSLRGFHSLRSLTLCKSSLLDKDKNVRRLVDIVPRSLRELQILRWHKFQFREPTEGLYLLDGLLTLPKSYMQRERHILLGKDKPHTKIDLTNCHDVTNRDKTALKNAFFSYVNSYDPDLSEPQPMQYTLVEYITWLRYRQRSPGTFLAERFEYVPSRKSRSKSLRNGPDSDPDS